MSVATNKRVPPRAAGFAAWAVGPWLVLLLAAFGGVQYLRHGEYGYLVAAGAAVVICAGCILRQSWARGAMQVLAVLLALWALVTGVLMLRHWGDFALARQQALAQPQLGEVLLYMVDRAQRTWQIGLVLKAAAIPLLLWLAWKLRQPAVRVQFRTRR